MSKTLQSKTATTSAKPATSASATNRNAYQSRQVKSIPAPVLSDSDDEFNPHAEINQVQKQPKKRKSTAVARGRKRKPGEPRLKYRDIVPLELREFLADIDSSDDQDENPATLRRSIGGRKSTEAKKPADDESVTEDSDDPLAPQGDDSVTETESEPDDLPEPTQDLGKRKAGIVLHGPNKRRKVEIIAAKPGPHVEDPDDESDPCVRPKFAPTPQQARMPSLVLSGSHILPAHINRFLRPYQRQGAEFFAKRYSAGRGGILADDMGLGKTIQVISFLCAIMQKHNDRRDIGRREKFVAERPYSDARIDVEAITKWPTALIAAPATLVGNWERELETWGHFEFGVYTGNERRAILRKFQLGKLDILLTSVDTMKRDIDDLKDLPFACIFIDECHSAKSPQSKMFETLHSFACTVRFGMTGTAVQNSYEELWCILDFAVPGQVGTLDAWRKCIANPLRAGQAHDADRKAVNTGRAVARALYSKLLPLHFLRREKHDPRIELALPKKTDRVVFCPLLEPQRRVYQAFLSQEAVVNMVRKDEICECYDGQAKKLKRKDCCYPFEKAEMLRYMDIILKVSNHPILIMPGPNMTPEQNLRNQALSAIAWGNGPRLKYADVAYSTNFCGKWKVLLALLCDWRKDKTNKVLIFTRSVQLLDFIDYNLKSCRWKDISFERLDGGTKQSERMTIVDRFNLDPDIFAFLISTRAGGTGLNLTSANKVVIFDPNWNPAHDMQAMDRAYRFGQQRDVDVFRLLSEGTLEENIYQRQVYKGQQSERIYKNAEPTRMFDGVQFDKEKQGELFGLKNIFRLKSKDDETRTQLRIERAELEGLEWALRNVEGDPESEHAMNELGDFMLADADDLLKTADVPAILQKSGVTFAVQHNQLLKNDGLERLQERASSSKHKERDQEKARQRKREELQRHREVTGDEPDEDEDALVESPARKKRFATVDDPSWPPKRAHHREPAHPNPMRNKLDKRVAALVRKGYIASKEDYPAYAKIFARYGAEQQRQIVLSLDQQ
ncbi:hypothetical protein AURDEDRAFT_167909 [Auricularia subglabra TFB-10046 SS5]|nr:hypothetical protein AURDEDRAFT_167909 [Auricularia subglabra TFB-10046 SS5]